ncbi:MAG: SPOR domain-containing protein [Sphingomicrobium sp.]
MADGHAAYDEQLPWLQAVDDEDGPRGVSARKMFALLLVVLLGAALVSGTFFWLGKRDGAASGVPELIKAEPGPYKVKPADPGGLDVAGESETAFQTSAGEDQDAQLDLGKLSQEPAARESAKIPPRPEPATAAAEPPKPLEAPEPAPAAAAGAGSVIQLGAFKNSAQAERAWSALSARFSSVAGMGKMIVPFPGGIRLRANAGSPAEAKQACAAIAAAGENCFVVR